MSLGSLAISKQTVEPVPLAPTRKRTLVVDDSETILHAICSLLEHHDVVEVAGRAESGTQAIDVVLDLKPDLILMDADMPGMSGLEFLTWARCEPPESIPPIAVLSYSKIELDRQLTQRLGAKAYFVKSPNLDETVAMTKNLLLLNVSSSIPGPNQNPSNQL